MPDSNVSPPSIQSLLAKIEARSACIGIIGLGYVGLPLALAFAARGFKILGFDSDESKVVKLNRGESYIGHIANDLIAQARNHFETDTRV